MSLSAGIGTVVALALDTVISEPPARVHPVAWFGRAVGPLDREWRRPFAIGLVGAIGLPVVAAAVVGTVAWVASELSAHGGALAVGVVLFSTSSLRLLCSEGRAVTDLADGALPAARERLRSLAGRDASELTAGEVRSAVVESLAENLADGLVAPLSGFLGGLALGAVLSSGSPSVAVSVPLALGAAGATWVKAVNTMDSMLGYRSKPVGTPAARLDDVVQWVPARVTALLLALAAGSPGALLAGRRWAGRPDSPNSGWPMAVMAAILDVRLQKQGSYVLNPAADVPTREQAARAIAVTRTTGVVAFSLSTLLAVVIR